MNELRIQFPETDVESLHPLLRPRSVAVIGASRRPDSIGGIVLGNLLRAGFTGPVYPVNRSAHSIRGVRAYPTLADVPDEIDLCVVVVPRAQVLPTVRECADKGVKSLVIITAGFAEVGPDGRREQEEIVAICRSRGMRLVGPNCFGILNTDPEISLNATFSPTWPPSGSVSFSSQSGALGLVILEYARELGIGVRHFLSVGNKADVSGNDLLEYWEQDPETRVILLYLESFGNPRRFMRTARRVSCKKPVVVVKSGRTESGARAASSHTGSLAGVDVAVDALFAQSGVIRTDTIEELFDTAMLLANQPLPRGPGVAILTNAGGPAIMASDACESRGLTIARLSDGTQTALRSFLPPEASVRNPVDMVASANGEFYERATRLLLADPAVDSLLILFVPPVITPAEDVANAIERAAAGTDKPVLTCLMGTHGIPAAQSSLRASNFPSYAFPEAAALALSRVVKYGRWRQLPRGVVPELAVDGAKGRAVVDDALAHGDGEWLEPERVAALFAAYGISLLRGRVATSREEAERLGAEIFGPVAVKLVSSRITHKSDVGGVVLGVEGADGLRQAWDRIASALDERGEASAMEGVLIQPMLPGGVETFVGMTLDPAFGPLLAFGIGGVNIELWHDVVFRVQPITDVDARQMLEEIRGRRLLDGFRGAPAADREALVDTLLRVSRMVADLPEIAEIDINPLVALAPGRGVVALDARVRVAKLAEVMPESTRARAH